MRRTNTWQDVMTTGVAALDVGDGIQVPVRVDGVYPGQPGPVGAGVPAGGSTGQIIRRTASGSTEWFSPSNTTVGLGNVNNTADYQKPVSEAQALALAKKVGKGELVFNVRDYGAKGDNTTDDTAAWLAAEDAAFTTGPNARLFAPSGNYVTSGTIQVRCELDASQATLRYYGTGTALIIGDESAIGKVTPRKNFSLPRVINMSRGTAVWDGTSTGVRLTNLDTCFLEVPFVQDFENGLVLNGYSAGTAYCSIKLGALWDNHKNLVLTNNAGGWANQNEFIGGRLNQTLWKGATTDDTNANQLSMVSDTAYGGPNNNTFIGTSFEGVNISYYRLDISGKYNQFINCRWENFSTPFRIRYRSGAEWNKIDGGYGLMNVTEVFDGDRGGGALIDPIGSFIRVFSSAGQVIPHNTWTAINTWATPTGNRVSHLAGSSEFIPRPGRWAVFATVSFAPNTVGRRIARIKHGTSITEVAEVPANSISSSRSTLKLVTSIGSNGIMPIIVECNQTSGADLALETSTPYVKLHLEYLGG